jgi:signal transduction histidine kinase
VYVSALIFWLTYLPLLPVPLLVARKYRLDLDSRNVTLLVHLCGAALFSYVQMFLASVITEGIGVGRPGVTFGDRLFAGVIWNVINNFPIPFLSYWAMVISMNAFYYEEESKRREVAAAQLEASLMEARLRVLQAQLSPHFFFNTLNAISALAVKGDPNAVVEMMARLGDFLRTCLDDGRPQHVPLAKEVELANSYLEIQKLCFGDRLTIRQNIAPGVLEAVVPSMILQPVVENAIVHGVAEKLGTGCVTIEALRDEAKLRLHVSDNGPGLRPDRLNRKGVGLSMTRSRLEQLYGTDYDIHFASTVGEGTTVTISIPFVRERDVHEFVARA